MKFLTRFLNNHVLANLFFVLILVIGTLSYWQLPREQDPAINFNWLEITTIVPGMAATDIEKRVTDILEDAVRKISDIRFVSSNSRESISNVLVRFEDLSERVFDKRVNDLRREVQNKEEELPDEAKPPFIVEITSANAFPTAALVVTGPTDDENLRRHGELVKKDLERIKGVDRIIPSGLHDPELQVVFDPAKLEGIGISALDIANTVTLYYRDLSAGSTEVGNQSWAVRVTGTDSDPQYLGALPVIGASSEVRLDDIAEVNRGHAEARHKVMYQGRPAIMLAVTKQESANTIQLVDRINAYVESKSKLRHQTGINVVLADDQTEITRHALMVMQNNAALGLALVLFVTWLFLGVHIALLTSIGIPFILAGTFWALQSMGQTLNVSVLLGVVISLGMLVDDAVVVVEGIYYRLQRGMDNTRASIDALTEVFAPVTTSVLTTMAAFLPLMLLPGILGKFMMVIPLVVTTALAISLVEAYWMLPSHIMAANINLNKPSRIQAFRVHWLHRIRLTYTRLLSKSLRFPKRILTSMVFLFMLAVFAAFAGQINPALMNNPALKPFLVKVDFFAADPLRLFYVNIEMPNGTPLETTVDKVLEVEQKIRKHLRPGEVRSVVSYAGQMFTEMAPFQGAHYGQILLALKPKTDALRSVDAMVESMRADVTATSGPSKIFFLTLAGGPPTSKPISIKVRGDEIEDIRNAAEALKKVMRKTGYIHDISDDDSPGLQELILKINTDASRRAGITPDQIMRAVRLMVDGEVVARMQDQGEELEVRVQAKTTSQNSVDDILNYSLTAPDGKRIPFTTLLDAENQLGIGNIRHYNFRRTITVEADIDKGLTDTVTANAAILKEWDKLQTRFANINLDFTGELDDINESLGAIGKLMLFGVMLMYLILGTQFRSYFQPLMILATVPMAFTGVVLGLLVTANPLSLFTLYGVVALAGIAVNAAIVLISAANQRLAAGMSITHATLYAARRRVIPILITSLTTIAGLFSLATGLGGKSLLWGPVATAIVWGLVVSTVLTLFVIPLLYRLFMPFSRLGKNQHRAVPQN
jgi:multidrug efflux pump subunit AcrB